MRDYYVSILTQNELHNSQQKPARLPTISHLSVYNLQPEKSRFRQGHDFHINRVSMPLKMNEGHLVDGCEFVDERHTGPGLSLGEGHRMGKVC